MMQEGYNMDEIAKALEADDGYSNKKGSPVKILKEWFYE